MKRGGGRRYYRPLDVDLLKGIRHLLYDQGYTIKGVQRLLRENGTQFIIALGSGDTAAAEAISQQKQAIRPSGRSAGRRAGPRRMPTKKPQSWERRNPRRKAGACLD